MAILRCLTLVFVVLTSSFNVISQTSQVVDVDEGGIRKSASIITVPAFPDSSRKRRSQGVAVIQLEYDGSGTVVYVKVLEAPDSDIGEAIAQAVRRWKFKPSFIRGKPVNIRGKLTFYCVIDRKGVGRVQNPKQFR